MELFHLISDHKIDIHFIVIRYLKNGTPAADTAFSDDDLLAKPPVIDDPVFNLVMIQASADLKQKLFLDSFSAAPHVHPS